MTIGQGISGLKFIYYSHLIKQQFRGRKTQTSRFLFLFIKVLSNVRHYLLERRVRRFYIWSQKSGLKGTYWRDKLNTSTKLCMPINLKYLDAKNPSLMSLTISHSALVDIIYPAPINSLRIRSVKFRPDKFNRSTAAFMQNPINRDWLILWWISVFSNETTVWNIDFLF